MSSNYGQFRVLLRNVDGSLTPVVGASVKLYDATNLVDLGVTLTSIADGVIVAGSAAVADSTVLRFRVEDDGHGRAGWTFQLTTSGTAPDGLDLVLQGGFGPNIIFWPMVLGSTFYKDPTVDPAVILLAYYFVGETVSARKLIGYYRPGQRVKQPLNQFTDAGIYVGGIAFSAYGHPSVNHWEDVQFTLQQQNRENNRPTITQYSTATTTDVTLKVSGFGDFCRFRKIVSASDSSVQQVETLTVTVTTVTAGTLVVTVTAAGMGGSPKVVNVTLAGGESDAQVATKIKNALAADPDVGGFFTFTTSTADVIATVIDGIANDSSMQFVITASHGVGAATSANTTAGVAGFTTNLNTELVDLTVGITDKSYQFESITPTSGTQLRYFKVSHSSASLDGPWSPVSKVLAVTFAGTGGGSGSTGGGDPTPPDRKPFGDVA